MKVKTSELSGIALDWAVTSIEEPEALNYGFEDWREQRRKGVKNGEFLYRWSTSWSQGGSIITSLMRKGLKLTGYTCLESDPTSCQAQIKGIVTGGSTPLIAAMRCYVAFNFGDILEIPEELL